MNKHFVCSKILMALFILVLSGCTGTSENKVVLKQIERLGAVELVETYYKSIQAKDFAAAKACLSKEYSVEQENYSNSDENNLKKLTNLKVKKGLDVGTDVQQSKKYFKEVQVVADYDAEYYKVITRLDGRQNDFIYVAKESKNSPWKITSIGSGP